MAAGHAIAPVTLEHVQNQPEISDYRYCPFYFEEYWESILPTLVSRSLIEQLTKKYDDSEYDSYCQLIADIKNTLRNHPGRQDIIVDQIKDFLDISPHESFLVLDDDSMLGLQKNRGERARTAAVQPSKKHNRRSRQPSKNGRTREEMRAMRDAEIDAQMGDKNRLRNTTQYEKCLRNHKQSPYYSDDAYEMSDSTDNPYVVKF